MAQARRRRSKNGQGKPVRIVYIDPDRIPISYVNNFFINHTAHEFVMTLAQTLPPPILHMTEEELAALEHVNATVVARIAMSPGRFQQFVKAASENYEGWAKAQGRKEE